MVWENQKASIQLFHSERPSLCLGSGVVSKMEVVYGCVTPLPFIRPVSKPESFSIILPLVWRRGVLSCNKPSKTGHSLSHLKAVFCFCLEKETTFSVEKSEPLHFAMYKNLQPFSFKTGRIKRNNLYGPISWCKRARGREKRE